MGTDRIGAFVVADHAQRPAEQADQVD